jgi:hypothetical protein
MYQRGKKGRGNYEWILKEQFSLGKVITHPIKVLVRNALERGKLKEGERELCFGLDKRKWDFTRIKVSLG